MQEELEKQREIVQAAEQKLERLRKELGVALLTRGQRADKIRLQQLEADRIAARVDMLSPARRAWNSWRD